MGGAVIMVREVSGGEVLRMSVWGKTLGWRLEGDRDAISED